MSHELHHLFHQARHWRHHRHHHHGGCGCCLPIFLLMALVPVGLLFALGALIF